MTSNQVIKYGHFEEPGTWRHMNEFLVAQQALAEAVANVNEIIAPKLIGMEVLEGDGRRLEAST